jgi:hypothetical protein
MYARTLAGEAKIAATSSLKCCTIALLVAIGFMFCPLHVQKMLTVNVANITDLIKTFLIVIYLVIKIISS